MTASFWHRLTQGHRIVHADADWSRFAGSNWSEQIMTVPVTDRYHSKQGRSIGRWTLSTTDGQSRVVYLKRHYHLSRWDGLLAAMVPGRPRSPGLQEWEHLAWARSQGFPVPRTPAVGELLGPWGQLQSFLAVEELTGMLALHEAIPRALGRLSSWDFVLWKRGLIQELARLTRELHNRRAFHQDLYLCHFYVAEQDCDEVPEDWRSRVWMIDFHRLTHRHLGWRWWQIKDLAQLLYSTFDVAGITPKDRARFWKSYTRHDPNWVTRAIRWKANRYSRHNATKVAPR